MRLTKLILWLLLCGPLALVTPLAHGQQPARVPGRIVAAKVQGTVVAINLVDHTEKTLASGNELSEKYEIKTAAGSSAILVFSNGATANLGADSDLVIEEFLMDPFAGDLSVAAMKEEPTSSRTTINLTRGELVGNVKHLREDKGSSFTINTPVGAAGIRGTTFQIVFRPDSNGKVFFTLSTAEGKVLLTGSAGAKVEVGTGKEVTLTVDVKVNAKTGEVTVTSPPEISSTKNISAKAEASIATAVQQIVETSAKVIITASAAEAPQPSKAKEDAPKTEEAPKPKAKDLPPDPALSEIPASPPKTTSGDGQ
jgi:hypothetical protein